MLNPATLSKPELIDLVAEQSKELTRHQQELAQHQQELAQHQQELARNKDIIRQLEEKHAQLEKDYLQLWRERFGRKSERYIENPDQLRLDYGDTDEAADAAEGLAEAVEEAELISVHLRRKPRKKQSHALPAHLPRVEKVIDVEESAKTCPQHGEKTLLPEAMWDLREKLVVIPPQYYVLLSKYKKYACQNEAPCGITSPERPTGIVEGDKYDTSVAAQIITNKYAFHLPLYRQQDIFAGSGWTPSRSLMLNILTNCFWIIQPLLETFKKTVRQDSVVACDDTGVELLYPKVLPNFDLTDAKQKRAAEVYAAALAERKSVIKAKMWAYRGVTIPLNVFDFTVSRHRDGPELFFQDYQGTILGDCWHGFESIAVGSKGMILRAACSAHARRKFDSAQDYPADRKHWLRWWQALWDVESEGRERSLTGAELTDLRQTKAKPIWDTMRVELESVDHRTEQIVLPKSDLRKALNYTGNHWSELTRYLDNPVLPIDNNECEQLMRQAALGRKNWLFAGSLAGGERSAGFMTLVSSAHRNDLDVWAYVNNVLSRLLAGETDYEPMLPWNWATANPASVRTYRQAERGDRQTRQRENRAKRRANTRR
jgi:transposase